MPGSWTISPAPFGSIHTFTAPEDGWCVTSHVVELPSQLIVVDAQYTLPLAGEVVRYSTDLRKPISRLYITHYHPDHLLGAAVFGAPAFGLPAVANKIDAVGDRIAREEREKVGDDIPDRARKIDVLIDEGQETVDGVRLVYRHLRHSETEDALIVELLDAATIIVQDLVYNGAHAFLGERRFESWGAALSEYRALPFTTVLPGHGVPGGPKLYDQMRDYLEFAEAERTASPGRADLKRRLLERFPNHGARKIVDHQLRFLFPS